MRNTIQYDERKFCELVLYIATKCQNHDRFGGTKLNKILFYSDFSAYLTRGKPITGAAYQKLQFGPAPKRLLPVQDKLKAANAAAIQNNVRFGGKVEKRLIPLRRPNLGLFDAEEIAIVDDVIDKLADASAVEVSDATHALAGWKFAAMNEEIPYYTALLPDEQPPLAPEHQQWARGVVREYLDKHAN